MINYNFMAYSPLGGAVGDLHNLLMAYMRIPADLNGSPYVEFFDYILQYIQKHTALNINIIISSITNVILRHYCYIISDRRGFLLIINEPESGLEQRLAALPVDGELSEVPGGRSGNDRHADPTVNGRRAARRRDADYHPRDEGGTVRPMNADPVVHAGRSATSEPGLHRIECVTYRV